MQSQEEGKEQSKETIETFSIEKHAMQDHLLQSAALRRQLREEVEQVIECGVCMERPAGTCLVACGHVFCCDQACSSSTVLICPICCAPVENRIKLFGIVQGLWDLPLLGDRNEGAPGPLVLEEAECATDPTSIALRLRGLIEHLSAVLVGSVASLHTQVEAINAVLQNEEGGGSSSRGRDGFVKRQKASLQAHRFKSTPYDEHRMAVALKNAQCGH
jgi:hypothetical protein